MDTVSNEEIFTPPAPEPLDTEPQPLSFGAKLWNIYVDPRKTFASVRSNHEWLILWLLVAAISIAAFIPVRGIIKQAQIQAVEEQLDKNQNIPAERRQEILDRVATQFDNPLYMLFVPAAQIIGLVVVAGILLFIGNIIFGGTASYLRMLNAYAWTGMIVIVGSLVTVPLIAAKGSMDVSIGLGVLAGPDTGPFLKKILTSFELFGLWQVWLSSVAVSVIAGVDSKKALYGVGTAWLVWVLIQGGLSTLGFNIGM